MPLPASPAALSLNDIQAEFTGSNPISISEYYRGTIGVALVPNITVNNNVPTSGQISFSNFHSAEQIDYTPTTFDINDIALGAGTDFIDADSNTITLAGINTSITLNIGTTNARAQASGVFPSVVCTLEAFKNGASAGSVSWSRIGAGSSTNQTRNMKVTVSSGDTLKFNFSVDVTGSSDSGDGGGTLGTPSFAITNDSSSNASIDTFTTTGSATLS